jgi:ribosomal protein L24E
VPIITTRKAGACTFCGGGIRKGEQAWFTSETGVRHPEPACRSAAASGYRTNGRAGPCARCGSHVPAGQGRLVLAGEEKRGEAFRKRWEVRCGRCS